MTIRECKLVSVIWTDSVGHNGWHSDNDIAAFSLNKNMVSVGFLTRETDELVVVSANRGSNHYGNSTVIPRACISEIKDLNE